MTVEQLALAGVLAVLAIGVFTVHDALRNARRKRELRAERERVLAELFGVRPKDKR